MPTPTQILAANNPVAARLVRSLGEELEVFVDDRNAVAVSWVLTLGDRTYRLAAFGADDLSKAVAALNG